jgi:hypothetical protein
MKRKTENQMLLMHCGREPLMCSTLIFGTLKLGLIDLFSWPSWRASLSRRAILLSSVSHLAAVGTEAYAEDLVRDCMAVRAVYGNGITVMYGLPLLLSGLHCYSTIRSLLEIGTWYKSVTALSTKELSESLSLLNSKLRTPKQHTSDMAHSTPEDIRAPERFLLKMPQN